VGKMRIMGIMGIDEHKNGDVLVLRMESYNNLCFAFIIIFITTKLWRK